MALKKQTYTPHTQVAVMTHDTPTSRRQLYRELTENTDDINIFSTYWWLGSLCGEEGWDVAFAYGNKGQVTAAIPFVRTSILGRQIIKMPPLTHRFSIWIDKLSLKSFKEEEKAVQQIISSFPTGGYINLQLECAEYRSVFNWAGFIETARYTYLIPNLQGKSEEELHSGFSSGYRNKIRKASKLVSTRISDDIDLFYSINKKTFERQKIPIPYSIELLRKHDKELKIRQRRVIFFAVDDTGKVHSGLYLTYDSKSAYVHMVGEDPNLRSSGAGIKLIYEALIYTKRELGLDTFDFEGSMLKNVEPVRRNCGGQKTLYSNFTRHESRLFQIGYTVRNMLRKRVY